MKIVFLDFDGVVTAMNGDPGSYVTHSADGYGPTPGCVERLFRLADETGAKFVLASNWRRFDDSGPGSIWRHPFYGEIRNPLPSFRPALGGRCLCALPSCEYVRKARAAEEWLRTRDDVESFVALDDMCEYEGYMSSEVFAGRYIQVDPETGFSDRDLEKAKAILAGRLP